ncbi:MFS transporter [Bacillus cereus]
MLVNGAAPILAPIIGGQLLQFTTWRGVFIVLGAISVFMLISAIFVLRETLPPEERETGGLSGTLATYRKIVKGPSVYGICIVTRISNSGNVCIHFGLYHLCCRTYTEHHHSSLSLFFAINGIGMYYC